MNTGCLVKFKNPWKNTSTVTHASIFSPLLIENWQVYTTDLCINEHAVPWKKFHLYCKQTWPQKGLSIHPSITDDHLTSPLVDPEMLPRLSLLIFFFYLLLLRFNQRRRLKYVSLTWRCTTYFGFCLALSGRPFSPLISFCGWTLLFDGRSNCRPQFTVTSFLFCSIEEGHCWREGSLLLSLHDTKLFPNLTQ